MSHLIKVVQRQSSQFMCKAPNNFQLLLVKLFSQTYYNCSDTKFWPDECLLCHTSVNPFPPPPSPSIFFWHFHLSITVRLFTICSTLLMFWSSNIRLSLSLLKQFRKLENFRTKAYPWMLFIQLIYSCFSYYHVPNNGVAPFSAYKHTQTTIPLFTLRKG